MRRKIAHGAIKVLAEAGVSVLTHRAVARAAGVSLAATTYHFGTKADLLAEMSRILLSGYLDAFAGLEARMRTGEEAALRTFDDLVTRVVLNALGRQRTRSLAWYELILHGARSLAGRSLAQDWYARLDAIWLAIGVHMNSCLSQRDASAAVDLAVGLTFLLHPLGLDGHAAADLLTASFDVECLAGVREESAAKLADVEPARSQYTETQTRIVQATIDILIEKGAGAVSYGAVAERAGLVRSGPSYHFPTIGGLLGAAQMTLFERAKARYRTGFGAVPAAEVDKDRLIDLTTAIFFREVLEFAPDNVAFYSAWLSAAQDPSLRSTVRDAFLHQYSAWLRRLDMISTDGVHRTAPLHLQAAFAGKIIREIASGADTARLSMARQDFAEAIRSGLRRQID